MSTKSVDDLLVRVQNEQTGIDNPQPAVAAPTEPPQQEISQQPETAEVSEPESESVSDVYGADVAENSDSAENAEPEISETKPAETNSETEQSPIDEYGNPIEKPRVYTEEEVQRMIRERLARVKNQEHKQPTQQQIQQAAEDGFQADPNSDDSWEVQLEQFIERTIEKRQQKINETQWRQQEAQKQAEFESKFTSGMSKYKDFQQVVADKPITDDMMLATRGMENPAAFIYAACKLKPNEINRIASIPDPAVRMMEIGRLDAQMRKEYAKVSNAPRPLQTVKGDMPVKQHEMPSLEQRIQQYAKQKFARR